MPESNYDNIDLRSEEVQEILTRVPHWMIRWGNALFLGIIVLLLAVSWFVKYPDIITSEATITTRIPPQKEYAKLTGKLQAILVEDNQTVLPGQPLAILENTANYKDVLLLKSAIDTITINTTDFKFPFDNLPVLFLGEIESAYALFENSYIQYRLNKELQPFSNEALANRYSIMELNARLQNMQSQSDISKTELAFKKKDLQRHKGLFEKGVISAQEYENKQLEYAQAERNFKNFETSLSQIREAISNAQKTSKGTEINRAKEETALLKGVIQTLDQLKKAIKDWEYQYVLQADTKGNVSFLNYWSINQTVNQGDLVFTVVPHRGGQASENSSYIAKLKTPARNSGKVKPGQNVHIKLENYPDTEFGVLTGKVTKISVVPDGEGFYYVEVQLPEKLITSYNKEIPFKQEMFGTAEIITEDLRLLERLFYQFKEVFSRK